MRKAPYLALTLLALTAACAAPEGDDYGIDEQLYPVGPQDKEDNVGHPGMKISTDTSATQVWYATNKWEDRTTTAAKKAGLAWGADSGLNWDEKFAAWVASMEEVQGTDGYSTFKLTTPWGKTVVAPVLECAETAIFLRATFAAWYNLPFYMEVVSSSGKRVYFGHFGIRTSAGKYSNTANFTYSYKDYSTWTANDIATRGWPHDATLRTRGVDGGDDTQPELGGGRFGTYLDEAHLNKRAGYFIIYLLNFFGSANLADSANTYNLRPESIRAGDILLHRWQRVGIGDTKILKVVEHDGETMNARLMSGSMPRRQAKLYDENSSKYYFTEEDTGGRGQNSDGDSYWKLGGGMKRWRVTKNVNGYWMNTWMSADESSWINDQDEERISARPEQFETLLGEVSPLQKRDSLLRMIDDQRAHLMQYPASCAARERREGAFNQLYELAPRLGTTKAAIDQQYRTLADYVFAELDYAHAKTCCWDSSSAAMAEIIMAKAEAEQAGVCTNPTVFKAQGGGYQIWADYAASQGRSADWKPWKEDESCPQRDTTTDAEVDHGAGDWCSSVDNGDGGGPSCTDGMEPNNSRGGARSVSAGSYSAKVCAADHDYYLINVPAGRSLTATIGFTMSLGDLDMELLSSSGSQVALSDGTTDQEQVTAGAGSYTLHVYGYNGATNSYSLSVSY